MTGNSPSTDRPAPGVQLCGWCNAPLTSPTICCDGRRAYLTANREAMSATELREWAREIRRHQQADDGSSSTRRGAGASRSWSVTGSSGLVCRRLKRGRSVSFWESVRSQRGMGTGRTSASSKSLSEVGARIGMVEATPASDCGTGWRGKHLRVYIGEGPTGYWTCLNCGRRFA